MRDCGLIPANRNLFDLKKSFYQKVSLFLFLCPQIFITESTRTQERQDCLVENGLSKVAQSFHQKGLAVDIAFRGEELYPRDTQKWVELARVAKQCGLDWGFDLWKWDKCHFQDDFTELDMKSDTLHNYLLIAVMELDPRNRVFQEYEGEKFIKEKDVKLLIEIAINRSKGC